MNSRKAFYEAVAGHFMPDRQASILVCGGGALDRQVLLALGFKHVTISNLDLRMREGEYAPFDWRLENAEKLTVEDGAFDYVVCHAALHHASSPHRMLLEMYRAAKRGVLAIEARDSLLMRVVERCGLTQTYEHAAVFHNGGSHGGVNNTGVPNYVFRWTEREVEKTIRSYAPQDAPNITFRYGTAFPCTPEVERHGRLKYLALKAMQPFYRVFARAFPRQQNLFAFFIVKPVDASAVFPWLTAGANGVVFNRVWAQRRYKDHPGSGVEG
jgi:SAM-dependent methyltransferase